MNRHRSLARSPRSGPADNERGAALILAIGVMLMVGLISAGVMGFVITSVRGSSSLGESRNRQYAADAAVESDIARVRVIPNVGINSCGGPTTYTFNTHTVRVQCTNQPQLVFDPAQAVFVIQRNVVFVACVDTGADCGSEILLTAQVNYQMAPATTTVSRAYVQSWSVNR